MVPFRNAESGLLDIWKLKEEIKTIRGNMAPNEFAFEMVEGVAKVRIVLQQ